MGIGELLEPIKRLQAQIRDAVVAACEEADAARSSSLSDVANDDEGDTIYAVDKVSEERILSFFETEVAFALPIVLIAEGIAGGKIVLPAGASEADAKWRIIVDPIDGTRGIMYQKRSAWVLTGVAPNLGSATCLQDIQLAVQTEIPLVKQHLCDVAWTIKGQGVHAERYNRISGESSPITLQPSRSDTIAHGFSSMARFFPGAREELSAIDEEMTRELLGPPPPGKALCFEDQYASTGGQLYELMCGHDRFVADLRPLMAGTLLDRGMLMPLCCHPYDLCTELIARELGVIVTDHQGLPVNSVLAIEPDMSWVGYANSSLQSAMQPCLQSALRRRGLLG